MNINFSINNYSIEIYDDPSFTPDSADYINQYKKVIGDSKYQSSSKHAITVYENDQIINNVIILSSGGATGIHESCYISEENYLFICAGNSVYKLSIPDLNICWKIDIDDATAFQIFKMNTDFIIHGELSISRIDTNGKIIWQNGGSDIFVTENGENDFRIENNLIYAESWDGRKYCFNYDGLEHTTTGNYS